MNALSEKKSYSLPGIVKIELDNEISLVLVSGNPGDPFGSNTPTQTSSDNPYKPTYV